MLNLNDINSGLDASFFAVSSANLKQHAAEDEDDVSPSGRSLADSRGNQSDAAPWEFARSPTTAFNKKRLVRSSFEYGGGYEVDPPHRVLPAASFVILGNADYDSGSVGALPTTDPTGSKCSTSPRNLLYWLVAVFIVLCLLFHAVGLLVFFTPWYNASVQVWIFRRFYSSFASSDFLDDIDAKRRAVAFVYLLFVGLVPTVVAASLWFALSSHRGLRRIVQTPSFLRRKPVFFSKWRPIYLDMTNGDLFMLLTVFAANAFIIIQVLLRAETHLSSSSEKVFRDVSRGFGFTAVFNLVWLLLFVLKPSSWNLYLDIFGVGSSSPTSASKHRTWLGILVGVSSGIHGICMAVSLSLKGAFKEQMFPAWARVVSDPVVGMTVFGEIALAAMVLGLLFVRLTHWLNLSLTVIGRSVCCLVTIGAICVHYPLAVAWLFPTLLLLLIQKAVAWTHSGSPVELVDIAPLPYGITRIVIRRNIDGMDAGGSIFTPGQFVYLNLPKVSRLQWSRCTIASSPDRNPGEIKLYVTGGTNPTQERRPHKCSWSGRVHDVAKRAYAGKQAPVMYVDGFYGPSNSHYYDKYRCLVLIAGGTGIVEVLSILEQLYHDAWRAKSAAFEQKAAQKRAADPYGDHVEPSGCEERQVWLLWTSSDVCLFKEFEELFFRIQALDPAEDYFRLRFFLTEIPSHDDLLYQRVIKCDLGDGQGYDPVAVKAETGALPPDVIRRDNPCRRAPRRRPQNRSALCCWPSRPFQQALSGRVVKTVALWLSLVAALPLIIIGEWSTLNLQANEIFHLLPRVRNVTLALAAAAVITISVSLVNEAVWTHQRKRQEQLHATATHRVMRAEMAAPSRGLKKLKSMNKLLEDDSLDEHSDLEEGNHFRDSRRGLTEIGPDVIERLKIYSMRPDVDKFLRTVGRSFPRFAGRIGVFVSGDNQLVNQVEISTLASEAATGEWREVNAAFDIHCLPTD